MKLTAFSLDAALARPRPTKLGQFVGPVGQFEDDRQAQIGQVMARLKLEDLSVGILGSVQLLHGSGAGSPSARSNSMSSGSRSSRFLDRFERVLFAPELLHDRVQLTQRLGVLRDNRPPCGEGAASASSTRPARASAMAWLSRTGGDDGIELHCSLERAHAPFEVPRKPPRIAEIVPASQSSGAAATIAS